MFGRTPTPKFNFRCWVWSGLAELPKPNSIYLLYFMRELHPAPLPFLVKLKLFGWTSYHGEVELELEHAKQGRNSYKKLIATPITNM